jgi:RNA polymerase sigma factor (sigma-70 family)
MKEVNNELIFLIKNNVETNDNLVKLYNHNRGFIFNVVRNKAYGIYEIDDLMQEAFLALVKAVEVHNENAPVQNFLQILKWCILNRIRNLQNGVPVNLKFIIGKYFKIQNDIIQKLGYKPNDDEMMALMDISSQQLTRIKQYLKEQISLNSFLYDDSSNAKKIDFLVDEYAQYEAQNSLEDYEIKKKVHNALNKLPVDIREILELIYLHDKSYKFISTHMNVSYADIFKMEKKGLSLLRKNRLFYREVFDYIHDDVDYFSKKSVVNIVVENEYKERIRKELKLNG